MTYVRLYPRPKETGFYAHWGDKIVLRRAILKVLEGISSELSINNRDLTQILGFDVKVMSKMPDEKILTRDCIESLRTLSFIDTYDCITSIYAGESDSKDWFNKLIFKDTDMTPIQYFKMGELASEEINSYVNALINR